MQTICPVLDKGFRPILQQGHDSSLGETLQKLLKIPLHHCIRCGTSSHIGVQKDYALAATNAMQKVWSNSTIHESTC